MLNISRRREIMSTVFSQIGNIVGTAIENVKSYVDTQAATKPTYFEQADEPTTAKSGDLWRDTDTGIIACLYIENGTKVWMEI
jgi:hypothetical protein